MKSLSGSRWPYIQSQHNPRYSPRLVVVLALLCGVAQNAGATWFEDTRPLMGTEVRVHLWHDDELVGAAALDAVFDEILRIERLMSTYKDDSQITEINNHAAVRAVFAGDELFDLIERSLDISILTQGAFDITYDSAGQYYDFRAAVRPGDKDLQRTLPAVDYRHVKLISDGRSVRFLRDGVRINLGGIAKGYAVERGIDLLRSRGVESAIVSAGGDTRLLGDRRGSPWTVGIRDPRAEGKLAMRIPLEDEAISTSGDYERFFIEDDTRYHHILVPATGKPARDLRSATVIGPDAVMTDALSTSVFVMGVDRGLRLITALPDYEAVVIDANGSIFYSDGLQPPNP